MIFLDIVKIILPIYIIICALLFVFQEKLIFFPEKLSPNFTFGFNQNFKEITIPTQDKKNIHALLFTSQNTKGLIFYLQGNAGSLNSWGDVAHTYTNLDYDVFMLDYRGYGKSEGKIGSEEELFQDIQTAYDLVKTKYDENNIIVIGYSIGTGLATKLASTNYPRLLILQAPFFSLKDLMKRNYPIIPTFLLRYKFENYKHIQKCKMPIVIFHGKADEVIPYDSSVKLKEYIRTSYTFIPLENQRHNGMTDNPVYIKRIKKILEK